METEPKTDGQETEVEQVTEAQVEHNETEQVEINDVAVQEQNNGAPQEVQCIDSEIQEANDTVFHDQMRLDDAEERGENEADRRDLMINSETEPASSDEPENEASAETAENKTVYSNLDNLREALWNIWVETLELNAYLTKNLECVLKIDKSWKEKELFVKNDMIQDLRSLQNVAIHLKEKQVEVQTLLEKLDDSLMCTESVNALRGDSFTMTQGLGVMKDEIHDRLVYFMRRLTEDAAGDESGGMEVEELREAVDGRREEVEDDEREGEDTEDNEREVGDAGENEEIQEEEHFEEVVDYFEDMVYLQRRRRR